jgi:4-hydroxybenzoate polyprenyltransferase
MLVSGEPRTAVTLGLAMVALQASIGSLNDLVDAARDAGRPEKPIAAGLVTAGEARHVAVAAAAIGLALSAAAGWGSAALALAILAVGYAYDLWFKGTAWSWLPFAVGIPLLPTYAAIGAVGAVPAAVAWLVPAAALAGGLLAIGNALADVEADRASGVASVATGLGERRSRWLQLALLGALLGIAVVGLDRTGALARGAAGHPAALTGTAAVAIGLVLVGVGLGLGSGGGAARRVGWTLEAIGVAVLAVGWLAAATSA